MRSAGALLVALALGCVSPPAPPAVCDGCNVVLVIADTLRADHLGSHGYARATSPAYDAFAAANVRFTNARSAAACTFPAMNALLTSQPVFRFFDPATRPGIPDDVVSLPRLLGQQGYATAAVSASPIVRRSPSRFNPVGGFGQGFEHFEERCVWHDATCVNRQAEVQLRTLPTPFFLYLHYMDPHDPYQPPVAVRGRFAGPYEGDNAFVADGDPNPFRAARREGATTPPPRADVDHLRDLYDESILGFDRGLAALLTALERLGHADDTIVVVVADHGEAFGEHGRLKHCNHVYDVETHVPLAMRLPPVTAPVTVDAAVGHVDIVPTLLDYLGLPGPAAGLAGTSVRPWIEGIDDVPPRFAFSAMGGQRSVTDGRFKLVLDLDGRRERLFDLEIDPGERQNVADAHPETLERLQAALTSWLDTADPSSDRERLDRARAIEEELRALGYLG